MASNVLNAPIARMYQAGKIFIPEAAEGLSQAALYIEAPVESLDYGAAAAGEPQVFRDTLWVLGRVSAALVAGTRSMNHAAAAMVATADGFVDSDLRADYRAKVDNQRLNRVLTRGGALSGLSSEDRAALRAKKPDKAPVFDPTGDRSAPGGDDTVYDYNGRPHEYHRDSNPDPTTPPDEDRSNRDEDEGDALGEITDSL